MTYGTIKFHFPPCSIFTVLIGYSRKPVFPLLCNLRGGLPRTLFLPPRTFLSSFSTLKKRCTPQRRSLFTFSKRSVVLLTWRTGVGRDAFAVVPDGRRVGTRALGETLLRARLRLAAAGRGAGAGARRPLQRRRARACNNNRNEISFGSAAD